MNEHVSVEIPFHSNTFKNHNSILLDNDDISGG